MKIKTRDLSGNALDWAVAKCEGLIDKKSNNNIDVICISYGRIWIAKHPDAWQLSDHSKYCPSTDWALGGLIKTNNRISTQQKHDGWWLACIYDINDEQTFIQLSHSELEAAMRCYVTSKLGDEVEIPEGII